MSWINKLIEKLNPAQPEIYGESGGEVPTLVPTPLTIPQAYEKVEVVRNGIDRCIAACASFDIDVLETIPNILGKGARKSKLNTILNYKPNDFQDINSFKHNLFLDYFLDGNVFLYWDGTGLYHLPAASVTIHPHPKTFIEKYTYGDVTFSADEIIHFKDNSAKSIYRGMPRLLAASDSINALYSMKVYQKNFFNNGAIPGLVIESPNVLGDKIKDRLLQSWQQKYSPTAGGKRPLILDGGLTVKKLADTSFVELDFENSIKMKEEAILTALGLPYILLRGGNNANISPNLRLFYLETVYPIVLSFNSALEGFFGFNLSVEIPKMSALQPDMKEAAASITTLVNGGVITANEAREDLRRAKIAGEEHDKLRIPANIAGSAADPSQGGRPSSQKPNT